MTTTQEYTDPATTPQVLRPEVRATLRPGTATTIDLSARDHRFVIDEPEALGGDDLGANPVEHLLAALGACQAITYQVWGQKLGLQIDSIDIELAGTIDLRGFFGLNSDVRPGFDEVEFTVRIGGPESDDAYADLVRQVDQHCPVLDGIVNQVPVRSQFVRV